MNLIQLDNIYLDPASKRIYVVYNGEYIELCTVNNLGFNERIGYGFGNMFNDRKQVQMKYLYNKMNLINNLVNIVNLML